MKRNMALKIVNPIIGILLITQLLSGFFRHSLPGGFFMEFHEINAIVLAVAVGFHVALNWNWVVANFLKKHKV